MIRLRNRHVDVDRILRAPASQVWELLVDTNRWGEWGPSVRAVECAHRRITLGSSGRILTALGFWVEFLVIDYDEGRHWAWSVSGIRATGHRLDVLNHDLCRLAFEIPLWAMPYSSVCLMALRRIAGIVESSPATGKS